MDVRIISIGALSSHPLRGERPGMRTGHGTTTLVRVGDKTILVDPGLPEAAVTARLEERAGLKSALVTHVFLTSFNPEMRRGLMAFQHAKWWIGEQEREQIGVAMVSTLQAAAAKGDTGIGKALEQDIAILRRFENAPDHLGGERGERVDLFPLGGVTPGLCGLVIAGSRFTTVICGDAVPTAEHLERGQVLQGAADVERAKESFAEAVEIGDLLIPGRDNLLVNPTKRLF